MQCPRCKKDSHPRSFALRRGFYVYCLYRCWPCGLLRMTFSLRTVSVVSDA